MQIHEEAVITDGDSLRKESKSCLDKIIVDLDNQQNVIADMIDPDFYERKKNKQLNATSPMTSSQLSMSQKTSQQVEDNVATNMQEFVDSPTNISQAYSPHHKDRKARSGLFSANPVSGNLRPSSTSQSAAFLHRRRKTTSQSTAK